MPRRDIYVSEGIAASHFDNPPPGDKTMPGDMYDRLSAVLINADPRSRNVVRGDLFVCNIPPIVVPLLVCGGQSVASDKAYFDTLVAVELTLDAVPGRCFICRRDVA